MKGRKSQRASKSKRHELMPSSISTRLSHHWIIPCGDRWFRLRSQTIVIGHLRFYEIRFDVRRLGSLSIHFRKLRSRIKHPVAQPDVGGERHDMIQDRSEPADVLSRPEHVLSHLPRRAPIVSVLRVSAWCFLSLLAPFTKKETRSTNTGLGRGTYCPSSGARGLSHGRHGYASVCTMGSVTISESLVGTR
jgi:hypothetical protein